MMRRWIPPLLSILLCLPASGSLAEDGEQGDPWAEEGPSVLPRRSPMGEAARSFLLPGWAQQRMGQSNRANVFGGLAAVMAPFALGVLDMPFFEGEFGDNLPIVLYGLVATLAGIDAYELAESSNRENGWELADGPRLFPAPAPSMRIVLLQTEF